MAYRLDFAEPPADSLRRVARERLEHALHALHAGLDEDPRAAVHEARKDVKKARALLRLYRDAIAKPRRREVDQALRDAARTLSSLRDATVLVETVDGLAERFAGRLPAATFGALREHVRGGDGEAPEPVVAEARTRLAAVLSTVDDWEVARDGRGALVDGLQRAYARGRAAFAAAEARPTDERLHEWRKRVKDLRYQQRLLRDAWPDVVGAQAKAAKELSELLGDDHDLAVLRPYVDDQEVLELLAHRRAELQDAAFRLGHRIYAEAPKRYARRMRRYVEPA